MHFIIGLLCLAAVIQEYDQQSLPSSNSYIAAVVEYSPNETGETVEQKLENRVADYVSFIGHANASTADIIVFPESTLTMDKTTEQFVPDPDDKIVPCDTEEYTGNPIQAISCAAKNKQKYVVINLTMKRKCSTEQAATNDERKCADTDLNLYNTNVVFDRTGAVISIYRKFNLYGEPDINNTLVPDMVVFETDFGVKFGQFICFDILFRQPAVDLVIKNEIRDFVFPTMWYSELPFLTSVQVQQGWAYTHNVNLLAAGAHDPAKGSSGTGIYAGRQGSVGSIISAGAESKIIAHEIMKNPSSNPIKHDAQSDVTPAITLKRDNIDIYAHVKLDSTLSTEQIHKLCYNTSFCCHFDVQFAQPLAKEDEDADAVSYTYVATAYYGNRKYQNDTTGKVMNCAIFACTNNEELSTCAQIFEPAATVENEHVFTKIGITGTFPANDTLIMPSTLGVTLLPLYADYFEFIATAPFEDHEIFYRNITMTLKNDAQHLLTFGIYGWEIESAAPSLSSIVLLVLFSILISVLG